MSWVYGFKSISYAFHFWPEEGTHGLEARNWWRMEGEVNDHVGIKVSRTMDPFESAGFLYLSYPYIIHFKIWFYISKTGYNNFIPFCLDFIQDPVFVKGVPSFPLFAVVILNIICMMMMFLVILFIYFLILYNCISHAADYS